MKFNQIIILFINYIIATEREESTMTRGSIKASSHERALPTKRNRATRREESTVTSGSIEKPSYERIVKRKKLYHASGLPCGLINAINWIMHYICNENDRNLIRDELILIIKNCLDLKDVTDFQKNLLGIMLEKIEKNENLEDFSKDDLSGILIFYYYYKHNEISEDQAKNNKNKFEEILKSRGDLNSLRVIIQLVSDVDFRNLINAMSKNLNKLTLIEPSNSDILRGLNICRDILENPIELEIMNYKHDPIDLDDLSNGLANASNVRRFTINKCNFISSASSSILDFILNNEHNERLTIVRTNLTEFDINNILSALKNDKMKLKRIFLHFLPINEDLYINLLEKFKNNNKLERLILEEDQFTSKIFEKALDILRGKNNLNTLLLVSNQIKSENINDIVQVLKQNKTLLGFGVDSKNLELKDYTSILNSISDNKDSKIELFFFGGKKDIFNSASSDDKNAFLSALGVLKQKGLEIDCNWKIPHYKCRE